MLVMGVAVVLVGLVSWLLYGVQAGRENRSYHPNGTPPKYVRLETGHTYWLAVPGGVSRLREAGVAPTALTCTATAAGQAPGPLTVNGVVGQDTDETKFLNRFGSFVAARSARVEIRCSGLGRVYVENAADTGFDWSGLWLVLASAALVVGFPLTISGWRRRPSPAEEESAPAPREYDEVE
jgi:hypothetical protein